MKMSHRIFGLCGVLALAACSSPPPPVFAPLDYSYLPPIVLNVASVNVVNTYVPDPGAATLIAQAPEPPVTALIDMLSHRLVAGGAPGTATATVETASIDQIGSTLTGTMTVRLDVANPAARTTGYTEASVTYSEAAPDAGSDQSAVQSALYDLTKQLMNAMNVQLQYQIQANLGSWLSASQSMPAPVGVGSAPGGAATGVIQTSPLGAPGAPVPATNANPVPNAVPVGPDGNPTAIPPGPPAQLTPSPSTTTPSPAPATPAPTAPATPAPVPAPAPKPAPVTPDDIGL